MRRELLPKSILTVAIALGIAVMLMGATAQADGNKTITYLGAKSIQNPDGEGGWEDVCRDGEG